MGTTKKVKTDLEKQLLKAEEAVKHKEKKEVRKQLIKPSTGSFKEFMDKIRDVASTKEIVFKPETKVTGNSSIEKLIETVYKTARKYNKPDGNPYYEMYDHLGGGSNRNNNKTKSMNKLSKKNNHTRRNNNKRIKNSKTKSFHKHRKVIPYSRSGSQSNRKKSKSKKSQKNVTFKRWRARK